MKKKAQAAMEFLMTYGWAILVVLVVIGALAYFGVLSPKKLLPDKCLFGAGVGSCTDFQANAAGLTLVLSNGLGESVSVNTIAFGTGSTCTSTTAAGDWLAGQALTVTADCTGYVAGEKTNEEVTITYYKGAGVTTGLTHSISGQVGVTIQT